MTAPLRRFDPMVSTVDLLLDAPSFDAAAFDRLAGARETYASTAAYLARIANARSCLFPALLDSESPIAAYRFAIRFGVLSCGQI